jgi:hypothetical protein
MNTIKTLALILINFNFALHAAENLNLLEYYPEFEATMGIINKLHTLVNQTDIGVKSPTTMRNGSLILQCEHNWNMTNRGLVAYFEKDYPTHLYTPFGDVMLFWLTENVQSWETVTEKFKQTCILQKEPFTENRFKHQNAYRVSAVNNAQIIQTQNIIKSNQERKAMLAACIAHYLENRGTLTELENLGERKKRMLEQRQAIAAQESHPIWPLSILLNMFDLSS